MSENKVLKELINSSRQAAISFGVAIIFMGLTFLPFEHSCIQKLGIAAIFLVLGVWVFSSAFWPMQEKRLSNFIKYGITMLAGIGVGLGFSQLIF